MTVLTLNGAAITKAHLLVLGLATLTMLSSGTNYVVGSYAPQYADKLHLSSTQISLVAAAGNWGVYMTGPLFGWIVDKRGPRQPIAAGALLLGLGYLGLYWGYQHTDEHEAPLPLLAFFSFLTGLGSCAGNTAGLNAIARTFGPETRGTAMGVAIAGYGLSAFVYATISAYISGDNTAAFLLILAIGTSSSFAITAAFLSPTRMEEAYRPLPMSPTSRPLFRSLSTSSGTSEEDSDAAQNSKLRADRSKKEIGGLGLFRSPDYWLLMVAAFCLTGTGLMWINTVGTMVVTLAQFNHTPGKLSRLQAHQTSMLSIFNCLGRLFSGAVSDKVRLKFGIKPIWWLMFLSSTFLLSQVLGRGADDLGSLTWATSLVGFSYGQFFGLAPIVLLDWFGLAFFSSNVGTLYVIPTFSSSAFSHLFGSIYDSNVNSSPVAVDVSRRADTGDHSHVCPLGQQCYVRIFRYTITACVLAAIISVILGIRKGSTRERRGTPQDDEEDFESA